MYLCKFNELISDIYQAQLENFPSNLNNILILWLSSIMHIFNIEIPIDLFLKYK